MMIADGKRRASAALASLFIVASDVRPVSREDAGGIGLSSAYHFITACGRLSPNTRAT